MAVRPVANAAHVLLLAVVSTDILIADEKQLFHNNYTSTSGYYACAVIGLAPNLVVFFARSCTIIMHAVSIFNSSVYKCSSPWFWIFAVQL